VPQDIRGNYFGFRGGLLSIVGLAASLGAGLMLDHIGEPVNYLLTLCLALCFALGGIYLYSEHHVPRMEPHVLGFREILLKPLADRNFRRLLAFVTYWQASIFLAAVFVYPYFLQHLRLSFSQVAIYQSIAALCTLFLARRWGQVADRVGNKAVLSITTFIAGSLLPLTWMLARPGEPGFIYLSAIVDAVAWSAIGPAIFNLSLATAPSQVRGAYLGVISLFSGVAGFLGGLLSAPLLEFFRGMEFTVYGFEWTAYHTLFFVSACFRMQAWRFLKPLHETRAWRTRDVLRSVKYFRFVGFFWR
jgi:hypothetical protein